MNGVVIGVGAGAAGLGLIIGPDRDTARQWTWSVDEDARSFLRPDSAGARVFARHLSDVTLIANLAYAYLGDALLNAAWHRDSPDVAWQLALIDTQVLAVANGLQLWTSNLIARERPYSRLCDGREHTADGSNCTGDYRYRSFYSNHTSNAFAMATATCTHHAYVPLYVGRGRWAPCAANLVLATATGVARIVADQHYLTDVIAGAAIGGALGWFIPWLHYARVGPAPELARNSHLSVQLVPLPNGVLLAGLF